MCPFFLFVDSRVENMARCQLYKARISEFTANPFEQEVIASASTPPSRSRTLQENGSVTHQQQCIWYSKTRNIFPSHAKLQDWKQGNNCGASSRRL
jgi:hypothetical protein